METKAAKDLDNTELILEGAVGWKDFQPKKKSKLDFKNEDFYEIPTTCGVYKVYTIARLNQLAHKREIKDEDLDDKDYNFKEKIEAASAIPEKYRTKRKIDVGGQVLMEVYNGQSYNLRQRIKEHLLGVKGNGCIAALNGYQDYVWHFRYFNLSNYKNSDNQVFRNFLEQKLRAKYGWPILCKV